MTCIVGLEHDGKVIMGADSAGVDGLSISIRLDEKVFINGDFLMGFTDSFRMGQLLRYNLTVEKQLSSSDDVEYMCTSFVDAVRRCFKDGGFSTVSDNVESGGEFLVGYHGNLYRVQEDFQVGRSVEGFDAIGCGQEYALGSMKASGLRNPHSRIVQALGVASHFSGGVSEPFTVLTL